MMGILNQNALENFFSILRASIPNNTQPSQHDIKYLTARLISMKIRSDGFEHKASNCEKDKDEMLDWVDDFGLELKNMLEDTTNE